MAVEKSPVALAAPRALKSDQSTSLASSSNSQSEPEPQHQRRLDRSKFYSAAEVEARYGTSLNILRQSKPAFPWPVSVGERAELFFLKVSILRWESDRRKAGSAK